MGSPLGPLMANVSMCSVEEKLESEGKMPTFYRRYVDDTLATVPDLGSAEALLTTLNEAHPPSVPGYGLSLLLIRNTLVRVSPSSSFTYPPTTKRKKESTKTKETQGLLLEF